MTVDDIIGALAIPREAQIDQRVPKKLLMEQGAPTPADKRRIQEGIGDLRWFAALKPGNVGVPAYRDEVREYLEIVVLGVTVRTPGRSTRLTELIHRAIPYPVVLAASIGAEVVLSLAHKRFSQGEGGAVVLDGDVVASPDLGGGSPATPFETDVPFLQSLPLAAQPRAQLCALYQGWVDCVEALQAARLTGRFAMAPSTEAAAARRIALLEHERIRREIASLRAQAGKEKQMARRVELNLTIRRLEGELARAASNL
jgi:Domain of unknown function (DUF4391)